MDRAAEQQLASTAKEKPETDQQARLTVSALALACSPLSPAASCLDAQSDRTVV